MMLNNYTDLAIIGAGPQTLTLITHLFQKKKQWNRKIRIFDPSGRWLQQWDHQFAAQEIPHLRSPAVHHPHPNPFQLRKFAENRPHELFEPYSLPGTKLFADFCQDVIKRYNLEQAVSQDRVEGIIPENRCFQLILASGEKITARRVVIANGGSTPYLPEWVRKINSSYPPATLLHSHQIDLRSLQLTGENILIVGGGLTSGHLTIGAIHRGAKVDLMTRRILQEKLFDADPGWLGPKYLKGFHLETCWEKRFEMLKEARNGGSMTPAMMLKLRRFQRKDQLNLRETCQVISANWFDGQWQIKCDNGEVYHYDRIWLATGNQFQCENHPLLAEVWEKYPTPSIQGLPVLEPYLRIKGTQLFLMGGLTALRLGPTARNLSGGIKASQLIADALVKPSLAI
jgi:hypothetical protein